MRIWQKIYFVTLGLFLMLLNAGLFLAASFIFQHNLELEKGQIQTECFFLSQNLEHDFSILEMNGRYRDEIIQVVVKEYQDYYEKQNIIIDLEKDTEKENSVVQSGVWQGGSVIQIRVEQVLSEPYKDYIVTYQKELTDLEDLWSIMKQIFAGISLGMSILLCFILYIFMKWILKPLDVLNEGVAAIAEGNYKRQIACRGKDEITELSIHVNQMAETIQRQMDTLREENRKKQQLMDNMAHELRTPLTSIYGYAEYLLRAKASMEEQYEGLSYIMDESRRLAKMGEMMLSMRLYQEEERKPETVAVKELTDHVFKLLAWKLQEKKITLEIKIQIANVFGEETMLINLFRNLIENAIRASKEGAVVLWTGQEMDGNAVFQVRDFGVGIEQGELLHIVEPFYRVDKARSRANGGVGLGLSVAHTIIEKHGGTLNFESEKGRGTVVTVTLPL